MSGIAGIFARDGRTVGPDELMPSLDRLAHRGPDGSGWWREGPVALGQRTLWNTPEAVREAMPLVAEEGPFAIIADVRLDNRDVLIDTLGLAECPSGEIGDGDLILRAYQRWGAACPEHLMGDFAFAIWDGPQQRVFCARDHVGLKPLLYHLGPDVFVFASEARAVRRHPAVPAQINEGRIADYLVNPLEGIDKTSTFFERIRKLPPAHRLIVYRDAYRLEPYWTLEIPPTLHLPSDDAYEEAFREVFDEAVRCRLRSHRPAGSMLSGGIDSSSIVCTAQTLLDREPGGGQERLLTFSAVSPDGVACVESDAIRAVVEAHDVDAHLLRPDDMTAHVGGLGPFVARVDDLFDAATAGVGILTATAARQAGAGTLFDGVDGDMVFGTDASVLYDYLRRGRVLRTLREARALSGPWLMPVHELLLRHALKPLAIRAFPGPVRWYRNRNARGAGLADALSTSIIDPAFAERIRIVDRFARLTEFVSLDPSLQQRHRATLLHSFLTVAVEGSERTAALCGLESRSPLLDRRLMAFCLSLPADQKMRDGQRKWILRRGMRDRVPVEVRRRVAWGEHHPAPYFGTRWFDTEIAMIRDVVADLHRVSSYLEVEGVQRALARIEGDEEQEGDERKVWQAVTLELWLEALETA